MPANLSAKGIYAQYLKALQSLSRPVKSDPKRKRLKLKPLLRLRYWNFHFFAWLGAEKRHHVYCNCKELKKSKTYHGLLEKRNYLWDLCWFLDRKSKDNVVLTLEQEFCDSPGYRSHWDAYFDDFTKILVASTQNCGVFIGNCPPRSKMESKEIIREFNSYYQKYGVKGIKPEILVILITKKKHSGINNLTIRGWQLQDETAAESLGEEIFEYDGQL